MQCSTACWSLNNEYSQRAVIVIDVKGENSDGGAWGKGRWNFWKGTKICVRVGGVIYQLSEPRCKSYIVRAVCHRRVHVLYTYHINTKRNVIIPLSFQTYCQNHVVGAFNFFVKLHTLRHIRTPLDLCPNFPTGPLYIYESWQTTTVNYDINIVIKYCFGNVLSLSYYVILNLPTVLYCILGHCFNFKFVTNVFEHVGIVSV